MGLKENFQQAVRELTGAKKEELTAPEKIGLDVAKLQQAVKEDQPDAWFSDGAPPPESTQPGFFEGREKEQPEPPSQPSTFAASFKEELAKQSSTTTTEFPKFADFSNLNSHFPPKEPASPPTFGEGVFSQPHTPLHTPPPSTLHTPPHVPLHTPPGEGQSATPSEGVPFAFPVSNTSGRSIKSLIPETDVEITVISKNTVIDGNIRSFANMSIDGDIKGDIETTKDIDLNGRIVGNLSCNNAEMHNSQIQGNVRMKGHIEMERDTLLIGDISSTFARVNGKVKGNLNIAGKAEFKNDSVVFGDISASTITVDDGAIIQGYVSTTFLNKEESRNIFPDTILISGE